MTKGKDYQWVTQVRQPKVCCLWLTFVTYYFSLFVTSLLLLLFPSFSGIAFVTLHDGNSPYYLNFVFNLNGLLIVASSMRRGYQRILLTL